MITTEVQYASTAKNIPTEVQFQNWSSMAVMDIDRDIEVLIRVVDEPESAELNQQFRHKPGATNVLSFPVQIPGEIELDLIGDLVICAPLVETEALQQNKKYDDHWAHLVVHGVLHLLGYDHIDNVQAQQMEAKEIAILKQLNIINPYYDTL